MKDQLELGSDPWSRPQSGRGSGTDPEPGAHSHDPFATEPQRNGAWTGGRFDAWPLIDLLVRRCPWLLLGGLAVAALGAWAGLTIWKTTYTATSQLVFYDSPTAVEVFGQRSLSPQTFASVLRAPELLQRVTAGAPPGRSPEQLATRSRVTPDHNSDIVTITVSETTPDAAVALANLYAQEAVRFTQELQARDAAEVNRYLKEQVDQYDADLGTLEDQAKAAAPLAVPPLQLQPSNSVARPSVLVEKLQTAREELIDLLARYTDAHPVVQAQRARVKAIEQQLAERPSDNSLGAHAASGGLSPPPPLTLTNEASRLSQPDREWTRGKLQLIGGARLTLAGRQRAAQSFADNPPGNFRILAPATPKQIIRQGRDIKVIFLAVFGGLVGIVGTAGLVLLVEAVDNRLKTVADVQRVAQLPVLATLGDLGKMNAEAHDRWAFRTWTALQGKLSVSLNHGMVCGIISSCRGEGRTTWINLLARAAHQRGFRVLTIATRPSPAPAENHANNGVNQAPENSSPQNSTAPAAEKNETYSKLACPNCGLHIEYPANTKETSFICPECAGPVSIPENQMLLTKEKNVLASPDEVAEQLMEPEARPMVHIPLPGWIWNLRRRKQWQGAIKHWARIDNVVILIELPPASVPEAVLLAEQLPNLIWLADTRKAEAGETRAQLETLRNAHCNLVGAVLNHSPNGSLRNRFPRWLACALLAGALSLPAIGQVAETNAPAGAQRPAPADSKVSLSVTTPARRAAWQQRMTVGPGDVLTFSLFSAPELTQQDVPIGPDGRVSFLEAQDILASGLTLDELRARFDEELAKYRRAPRAIITPVAFRSKKYFVLGGVTQKGVYTLDRPITIIEAVARARGLETGLSDRTAVELADLSRSFLVRQGKRVTVDFEKLFQAGDLAQNIPIEPDDYLYFPVGSLKEVYVLGEVTFPGTVAFNPDLSAIGAISVRGGFTPRAWKGKVLVVRGSLNHPDAFDVDAAAILSAKIPDFKLQPRDIVYVSHRPWIKVEELLDSAVSAFIESAVITAVGLHIGP